MKKIKYLVKSLLVFTALVFTSCETEDHEFGDIVNPTNLQVSADLVGFDDNNPNGDGSGTVHLTAVADNAITFKFVSNGVETMAPSGMITYNFSTTGLSNYEVTVIAIGTAGVVSNTSISLDVLVLYSPPQELLDALYANSWRVKAEESGHLGVGPSDGLEPIWYAAAAFDKVDTALYDDRYTFSTDGILSIETFGAIFGKKTPIDLDYPNNTPYTADDPANDEYFYYAAEDFSSSWSVSAPGGVESINLTSNGYLGMYVGGDRSYTILGRSSNTLYLRTIGLDGNAWYMTLTNEN
jgi:hypothetical protein|tara:strand:- start:129 stop:1016 length:888 start_codon:yes stop_codon:yes gene_type:complete